MIFYFKNLRHLPRWNGKIDKCCQRIRWEFWDLRWFFIFPRKCSTKKMIVTLKHNIYGIWIANNTLNLVYARFLQRRKISSCSRYLSQSIRTVIRKRSLENMWKNFLTKSSVWRGRWKRSKKSVTRIMFTLKLDRKINPMIIL